MKTVLICPLDWGIGHATRCVPVIREFVRHGFRVVIGADRRPLSFLEKEFPELKFIRFPGTHITYPVNSFLIWRVILQIPKLVIGIRKEHTFLKKLIKTEQIDLVVSDNRYGLYTSQCPTVFITHQLQIQLPPWFRIFSSLVQKANYHVIRKFTQCWIPDFQSHHGLAGELSHPKSLPANASYIGTLSRFQPPPDDPGLKVIPDPEVLVWLSGPEPQRTILERQLLTQILKTDLRVVIIRGTPEREEMSNPDPNITIYSHVGAPLFYHFLNRAKIIICRSGYSSIMDVAAVGKRAIFIPTPGQTEQIYLSGYLSSKKIYFSMPQEKFDLLYALGMSINFPGMVLRNDYHVLRKKIAGLNNLPPGPHHKPDPR